MMLTETPVAAWQCDACPATGYGQAEMFAHTTDTHHTVFTAR